MLDQCVRMADLRIRLHFRHPELAHLFAAYRAAPGPCALDVRATEESIERITRRAQEPPSPQYAEFLAISEALSERLPLFDGVMSHAACLAVDGYAYLFLAQSGTGKTTHMRLWMQVLGPRAVVINGDKPFLRLRPDGAYAYGSPWAGKENLHANLRAPIGALIFIARAEIDELVPLDPLLTLPRLIQQIYMPHAEAPLDRTLATIDEIVCRTPAYLMRCTMRDSAAHTAIAGVVRARQDSLNG